MKVKIKKEKILHNLEEFELKPWQKAGLSMIAGAGLGAGISNLASEEMAHDSADHFKQNLLNNIIPEKNPDETLNKVKAIQLQMTDPSSSLVFSKQGNYLNIPMKNIDDAIDKYSDKLNLQYIDTKGNLHPLKPAIQDYIHNYVQNEGHKLLNQAAPQIDKNIANIQQNYIKSNTIMGAGIGAAAAGAASALNQKKENK